MPIAFLHHALHAVILAYLGAGALLAGLVLAAFSALLSFWAGWTENGVMIQVGRRAFYATAAMLFAAAIVLETALLTHDFSLAYVTEHSDLATPIALVAAAFYGGQEGSLLYWALILGILGSASLVASAALGPRLAAYAAGMMAAILTFFLVVLVLVASPFDVLQIMPPDGLGLNPVLRDGGMLIHPPVVLAGFASFAVPFSFAAAALLAGRTDAAWIAHTRRFALVAWGLQSTGLVLGVSRPRLGRLLGLGPGRERRLDAMARDHGIPSLIAGSGTPRAAACLELRARHARLPARRVRHFHRAQRDRSVCPHFRDQRDLAMVPGLPRRLPRLLSRPPRIQVERPQVERGAGAGCVARGSIRLAEPAAHRRHRRGVLGHHAAPCVRTGWTGACRRRRLLRTGHWSAVSGGPPAHGGGPSHPLAPRRRALVAVAALAGGVFRGGADRAACRRCALAASAARDPVGVRGCRHRAVRVRARRRTMAPRGRRLVAGVGSHSQAAPALWRVPRPPRPRCSRHRPGSVALLAAGEGCHAPARSAGCGGRLHADLHRRPESGARRPRRARRGDEAWRSDARAGSRDLRRTRRPVAHPRRHQQHPGR